MLLKAWNKDKKINKYCMEQTEKEQTDAIKKLPTKYWSKKRDYTD